MLRLLLCLTAVLHFRTCASQDPLLCTVTGPSVIDVSGHVNSVQDRCAYTLMKTSSIPGFKVHGIFQERRLSNVSFLDRVILQVDSPSVKIYLEQGGRVKQDNTTLTLNATPQTVHGVELSKDAAGVTAKMSGPAYSMTVFFDGNTAQMNINGPDAPTVEGLCGNSNKALSEDKASDYSQTDCEAQHEDTSNSTISCDQMTARCNLLKATPFNACHSHAKVDPYVTACTNTLCSYPAVDNLDCQFLGAYARACNLYSSDTLSGWKSSASCTANTQALCQDQYCSTHEFCGENSLSSGIRCHCRAITASPYRSNNTFGDVVDNQTSRVITLFDCLLGDKGISYTALHLYDRTCRAQIDSVTHMVTMSYDTSTNPCGTMIRLDKDFNIINKNGIIVDTTKKELIDLAAPFVIPDIKVDVAVSIKIKNGTSTNRTTVQYVTSGVWNYTLSMKPYTDAARTQLVDSDTELHLNQKVWFEITTDGLDQEMVALVTDSCFATSEPDVNASLSYDLIINGCANPADKTVQVVHNGQGTSNYFSFNMFQFKGQSREVYLHCTMKLCNKKGNKSCTPNCNSSARRRRAAIKYVDEQPVTLTMAWGN